MKKFEEINIGDKEQLKHTITHSDIQKFVELSGDDNKLHVDESFARQTSFKKPVVHGMIGASFISTVIGTKLPGDGALWFSQSLEFLLPVRVGDLITVSAEVIKKYDTEQIIELNTVITNQDRQVVTKGIAKVKMIAPEPLTTAGITDEARPKTALIIGATGGIGQATCLQLAKDGFQVIIHYHQNKKAAEALLSAAEALGTKAITVQADILQESSIKELIAKGLRAFEQIDVLINCAAVRIPNIKVTDLVWADFQQQFDSNIKSSFLLVQQILPSMLANGSGKIIHVGSLAFDKPNAAWSHYITAKGALVGFTRSLAFELAPKGITVNMVTPSLLSTELTGDIPEKVKLVTAAQTPLKRLATVQDVANSISFLASSKADFITGENIRINGGQVML